MEIRDNPNAPESGLSVVGVTDAPLATAAALDSNTFAGLNPNKAIPATWEERARKAWEYYLEEPLVKNCVNSWRTFAVGDCRVTIADLRLRIVAAASGLE